MEKYNRNVHFMVLSNVALIMFAEKPFDPFYGVFSIADSDKAVCYNILIIRYSIMPTYLAINT